MANGASRQQNPYRLPVDSASSATSGQVARKGNEQNPYRFPWFSSMIATIVRNATQASSRTPIVFHQSYAFVTAGKASHRTQPLSFLTDFTHYCLNVGYLGEYRSKKNYRFTVFWHSIAGYFQGAGGSGREMQFCLHGLFTEPAIYICYLGTTQLSG